MRIERKTIEISLNPSSTIYCSPNGRDACKSESAKNGDSLRYRGHDLF